MLEDSPGADLLEELFTCHAPAGTLDWLRAQLPAKDRPFVREPFLGVFAGIARRVRGVRLELSGEELTRARERGVHTPAEWSLADFARAGLLLSACRVLAPAEHLGIVKEAYSKGDNAERVAVLRALPLLPEPARFLSVAAESCRSHVLDVFRAIARDNPYPSRYFSDASFNQLVMKALFLDIPIARIVGLVQRKNAELYRMARDYEVERRAAGRSVSTDLEFAAHGLEQQT